MKEAVKLGFIYAALSMASVLVFMFFDIKLMFSGWSALISLIISIGVLVIGGRMLLRKREDIDLGYGSSVKYLFVAAMIGFMISTIATIPLFANNQDVKEAYIEYQKAAIESSMNMVTKLGGDEDAARDALEELEESIDSGEMDLMESYPYTWSKLPLNIGIGAIMALIYALIAAAFVKVKYNS